MEWLFSWEVTSVIVGILVGVGIGVLAMNDFKIAKVCFGGAAAYAIGGVRMWEAHDTLSTVQQVGLGSIALCLIFLLLVAAFRYTDRKEGEKKQERQLFSEEFAKMVVEELKKAGGGIEPPKELEDPQVIPPGEGFVQFENRSIVIEREEDAKRITEGDLRVGEIIKVKFTIANRGQRPVHDCQSWGHVVCVDPAKNPGKQLREVWLRGIKVGYEQFKKSGNDLGVGKEEFNFGQSTPLTKEELDGLKNGSLRVHVLLGGAWSDAKGNRFYWTNAEWTNWPQVPFAQSLWKGA
jgi:hypothetical protein